MAKRGTTEQMFIYAQHLVEGRSGREAYFLARGSTDWTESDRVLESRWRTSHAVQAILRSGTAGRTERPLDWWEVEAIVATVARIDHQGDPVKARAVIDALRFWKSTFGTAQPIAVQEDAVREIALTFADTTGL